MKPDWDKLADKYETSTSVLVGDVDCTVEHDLQKRFNVQGFPTLKYFKRDGSKDGEKYQGGRSFDDLLKFVEDELEIKCVVADRVGCTERELKYIEKMESRGQLEVAKQLTRLQNMKSAKLKKELKEWLLMRLRILEQM